MYVLFRKVNFFFIYIQLFYKTYYKKSTVKKIRTVKFINECLTKLRKGNQLIKFNWLFQV